MDPEFAENLARTLHDSPEETLKAATIANKDRLVELAKTGESNIHIQDLKPAMCRRMKTYLSTGQKKNPGWYYVYKYSVDEDYRDSEGDLCSQQVSVCALGYMIAEPTTNYKKN